jgi:DNA-directed RNA polymerase specialized sigma24 family protein
LQSTVLPSTTLAEFYRFAVLLAGSAKAAERVMADVLAEAQVHCEQLRNETSRRAWLVSRIRQRSLEEKSDAGPSPGLVRGVGESSESPEVLQIEAFLLAQRFHALPEPERTALALLHLDLFGIEEVAKILKLNLEELAGTLGRARLLLRDSLKAMREEAAPKS